MTEMGHDQSAALRSRPSDGGRRAAWASMIGAIAEWYDYFLYGTAAALVLGKLYFPGSVSQGILAAFATFAIGFFFRPVGAAVFGHFGDRLGRQRMLVLTMIMMGGASTVIGFLPTYSQIGIAAPLILVLIRAIQGLAVGGEYGGAALMAIESAPAGQKALRGSLVQSGAFIGLLIANGMFFIFASILSSEAFESWGWRVPFLLSAVIVLVGYWLRRTTPESPEFEKAKTQGKVVKLPLMTALRKHPKSFVIIIGLYLGANVATYMVLTFGISYGATYAGLDRNALLMATTIAAAVALVTIPLAARCADKIGYFRVFAFGALVTIAMAFPFFWSLHSGNELLIVLATVIVLAVGCGSMVAVQQPIFTQLFEVEFRYSGAGFAAGLGAAIGGLSPFIATGLVTAGGGTATYPALYMIGIGVLTLLTAIWMRKKIGSIYVQDSVAGEDNVSAPEDNVSAPEDNVSA
jgi:MHS family shikimate/dehydroshikimate transporter-like MFS transporter